MVLQGTAIGASVKGSTINEKKSGLIPIYSDNNKLVLQRSCTRPRCDVLSLPK